MGEASTVAKAILDRPVPYLTILIALKVIALIAIFLLQGPAKSAPVLLCAAASAGDVVLRVLVSRSRKLSPGKHGADVLLAVLLLLEGLACSAVDAVTGRGCKALRLVVPFAVLVSLGGNAMRLSRPAPARSALDRDCEMQGEGEE